MIPQEMEELMRAAEAKQTEADQCLLAAAHLHSQCGAVCTQDGHYFRAFEQHCKAAHIYRQLGLLADAAVQYVCIATAATARTEDPLSALRYYEKAAKCYRKVQMNQVAGDLYRHIANLYRCIASPQALKFSALADFLLQGAGAV